MRTLIIPDIHHKWKKAEQIILHNEYDNIIFLGDYFDDFDDTIEDAKDTAKWLKDALTLKNSTFLLGNHDTGYAFPRNPYLKCSGFSVEKCNAINRILTPDDWGKFKLFHFHQEYYISHGGISPYIFAHPTHGISKERLEVQCHEAWEMARDNLYTWYLGSGVARGGLQPYGGIIWLDFNIEFEPIPNISQIVGHTPGKVVRMQMGENSLNYCLDTHLNHIGFLENTILRYEEV